MREIRVSSSMSGMWKRSMAWLMRHRQTKGPGTDRPDLNHRATSRLYTTTLLRPPIRSVWRRLCAPQSCSAQSPVRPSLATSSAGLSFTGRQARPPAAARRSVGYAFAVFRPCGPRERRLGGLATGSSEKSGLDHCPEHGIDCAEPWRASWQAQYSGENRTRLWIGSLPRLLIDPDARHADLFRRDRQDNWVLISAASTGPIGLASVGVLRPP